MFGFLTEYLFTKEEHPTMENFNARLEMLNALKNHWWKRRAIIIIEHQEVNMESVSGQHHGCASSSSISTELHYSDTVIVYSNNSVELDNAVVGNIGYNDYNKPIQGKYYQTPSVDTNIYYAGPSESITPSNIQGAETPRYGFKVSDDYKVTGNYYTTNDYGEWEYIQSSDRSAYPDSGEKDGYEYQYLGVPFENAVGAPKIETGSYVGTGTSGSSNPNSLTFGFVPKIIIFGNPRSYNGNPIQVVFQPNNTPFEFVNGNVVVAFSGNSVSWYSTSGSAEYQLNKKGSTYYYTALG